MAEGAQKRKLSDSVDRVGVVFTCFPVLTETFLLREVSVLRALSSRWEVIAIWGREDSAMRTDRRLRLKELICLLWMLPYWLLRRPRALAEIAEALVFGRIPTLTNYLENLLGIGAALLWADKFGARYSHLHAVWSSGPGALVWAVNRLVGVPYSLAGHAYDLFEGGGDGLLTWKVCGASFVRSSTECGLSQWERHGAQAWQLNLIRRGLLEVPKSVRPWDADPPYRLLAVGRLVEKMGYPFLLRLLSELKQLGIQFEARIVGAGPLLGSIREHIATAKLTEDVELLGRLPFEEVKLQYAWADLFLFTGEVARDGDRAGFPNAVGEAMAWGIPVVARSVGGVAEVIKTGQNGLIIDGSALFAAQHVRSLLRDKKRCRLFQKRGRAWVLQEFQARKNVGELVKRIEANERRPLKSEDISKS